jgi:hypothetical protein
MLYFQGPRDENNTTFPFTAAARLPYVIITLLKVLIIAVSHATRLCAVRFAVRIFNFVRIYKAATGFRFQAYPSNSAVYFDEFFSCYLAVGGIKVVM